jgi:peptidoglycan/LPS O-acetylase OafA/YrhL
MASMSDGPAPRASPVESANLDLLRTAAVSFVVVFHLALYFGLTRRPGFERQDAMWGSLGHWGVLVFFVHTCLVLMQSMVRLQSRIRGRSLFLEFMVRRCFRLMPLSMLAVVVVALFHLPVGHLQYGRFMAVATRPVDVVANLLLVENLTNVEPLEAPLWSLPFEMQMYLVLPAIFLLVQRRRGAGTALGLWAAAFIFGLAWQRHRVFEMPAYVPCFLAGVVAFKLAGRKPRLPHWLWPIALAAIAFVYLWKSTLTSSWVCCLALGLLIPEFAEMPEGFVRRACHLVARYSYGVYLAHFILIWLAFDVLGGEPAWVSWATFAVLLAAIPVALFHLVESPMIRVGGRVADRLYAARLGFVPAALAVASLGVVVTVLRTAAARRTEVLGLSAATPADAPVRLVGRFDFRDPEGPRFAWPGTAIAVSFDGTGLDMRLKDYGANFLSVAIDGATPVVFSTIEGAHDYALASNLPSGRHQLVVTKRTEASAGVLQYLGVKPHGDVSRDALADVSPGALAGTPERPSRRIEFVGDSIECGYGVLGPDANCPFTVDTEDATLAYPSLAAQALGAQATVLAYSGKGMFRDYEKKTADQVPVIFSRALPDDPTSGWAFDGPAPDAVVVDVATNDYVLGDPGPAFRQAYVAFLGALRARYPRAYLVAASSAMMTDIPGGGPGPRSAAMAAIEGAVDERQASGDRRVVFLPFDEQLASDGYGCEKHPGAATHRRMARVLAATLRRALGW